MSAANGSVRGDITSAFSNLSSDPFYKPPVQDHPLVWVLEDVAKNKESDAAASYGVQQVCLAEAVQTLVLAPASPHDSSPRPGTQPRSASRMW
eukprot:1143064-Pelagomonas_calceolata.AAC.2